MVYDNDSDPVPPGAVAVTESFVSIFSIKDMNSCKPINLRNPAIGDVLSVCQTEDSTFYAGASSGLTGLNSEGERCVYANSIKATGS